MNNLFSVNFFSGIGGMSKGAHLAGFVPKYNSDIWDKPGLIFDANKSRTDLPIDHYYKSNGVYQRGGNGDIKLLSLKKINEFLEINNVPEIQRGETTLLTGGSCCQDISRVNPNRNWHSERSALMFEQLRLLRNLLPNLAIFEQVDSILDKPMEPLKKLFFNELKELSSIYDWDVQIMNAKHFGARQDRKRAIFMIVRKDIGSPSFPKEQPVQQSQKLNSLLPDVVSYSNGKGFISADNVFGTMTSNAIKVITTDRTERTMTIDERKILCNLEDTNLDIPGVSTLDKYKMMGNMVQIPFMYALAKHIKENILRVS